MYYVSCWKGELYGGPITQSEFVEHDIQFETLENALEYANSLVAEYSNENTQIKVDRDIPPYLLYWKQFWTDNWAYIVTVMKKGL